MRKSTKKAALSTIHRAGDKQPDRLFFKVGTRDYLVKIVRGPLIFQGNSVAATCNDAGEILIADDCPPRTWLGTLLHEIGHAYLWEFKPNRFDDEHLCEMVEAVGKIVIRQLADQGGEAALMAMTVNDPISRLVNAMRSPDFELDTNEAAVIISAVDTAKTSGHRFDTFTLALVDVLRRQLTHTEDGEEQIGICDGGETDSSTNDGVEYGAVLRKKVRAA